MSKENPNYQPNALSRLYAKIGEKISACGEWLPEHYFRIIVALCLILLAPWFWLMFQIGDEIFTLVSGSNADATAEDRRNIAYALGVNITALAGLLAAPLIIVRAWIHERQTIVATRQAETAEQGLITDRFTRAVEQLGAEKTVRRREFKPRYRVDDDGEWLLDDNFEPIPATRPDGTPIGDWETIEETVPNLEVRLGAIYALERIAQDSERDHIPIMETLCAYIRENAPASGARDHGLGDWPDWPEDADDEARAEREQELSERSDKLRKWATALPAPRVDVQAALSVIGRRGEERIAHERRQRRDAGDNDPGFRLDLRGASLQNADLTRARLDHALLTGARLEGAHLREARLEEAHLRGARLEGAHLGEARLEGANLREARMEGANLKEARLEGAHLRGARLEGADLHSANLKSADLRDWTSARTSLRAADFTDAKHLTQDHFNAAFGDSATILPKGIAMPDHWDDETIHLIVPDKKYQAWLADGAPPGKPPQAPPG